MHACSAPLQNVISILRSEPVVVAVSVEGNGEAHEHSLVQFERLGRGVIKDLVDNFEAVIPALLRVEALLYRPVN